MAPRTIRTPDTDSDDDRAATVRGLVEILVGTAAPTALHRLPRWEDIVSAAARPGTGGRRKRVDVGFEIEATRELRERYGDPEEIAHRGSLLLIWQMDPDGDGILAARLSGQDVQKGETAMAQIHGGLALAATHGLKPACAVVAMRTSGGAEYERRLDFTFIRDRIAAGGLQWVCYRGPDRVARDQLSAYSFYGFLEATDTDLYLCSLGRSVDWNSQNDKLMIGTLGVIGQFERGIIKERTHTAIKARFVDTGRGYPGFIPIGTRRNAQMYLEQDPEQWPYIVQASEMYARLRPDGGTSIRQLATFLTEKLGFTISANRIRLILKDPFYVTGEAHVTYQGVDYPLRPIKLVNPVPAEIFERNQALMAAVRGRQRQNPLGHFLLNRIEFLHDTCQHHVTDQGLQVRLRGKDKIYTHDKRCPFPECRRFTLPHKEVDAAIVAELLRLCEDPDLQRRYQQRARNDTANPPAGVLSLSQQRSHEARVTDLTRQREQIQRDWLSQSNSQDLNPLYLQESLKLIDAEITRLERQLDLSKRLRTNQRNPRSDDRAELLERAREILTPEPPDDPELRQRRLIFVQQALSKVVARRTTTGFELELYGPLIPADATPLHFDPLEHGRPCLQSRTDPESRTELQEHARNAVARWRGSCGPAWRSEAIGIRWSRRAGPASRAPLGPVSLQDVRVVIRAASDAGAPGPIRPLLERHLAGCVGFPAVPRIVRDLAAEGLSLDGEARAVLGAKQALRLRRVLPSSVADWELLVCMAIDEGLTFDRGWAKRWDELHARVGWLGSHRRMRDAQRSLGFSLVAIAAAELQRRGAPAMHITDQPGRGRDTSLEACFRGLREAARHAPPGRLSRPKIKAVLDGQDVLPTERQISNVLSHCGVAKATAVRLALGQREALVSGRVVPRTHAEWITVMSAAIDDGYTGDRGWIVGWNALCQRHPRYVLSRTVRRAVEPYGGLRALHAAALRERDTRKSVVEPIGAAGQ